MIRSTRSIGNLAWLGAFAVSIVVGCSVLSEEDASVAGASAPITQSTTLIARGATWKYLDDGSNQRQAWVARGFGDSGWASGRAELGYGDNDESTVVSYGPDSNKKYATTYFRRTFTVSNPSEVTALTLSLKRDDGAVVYLNGTEVFRTNMPSGTVSYTTAASSTEESDTYYTGSITPSLLVAGENVVAVEIHQNSATSTDLSFDLELTAEVDPGSGGTGGGGSSDPGTLVARGTTWRYLDDGSNQGTQWRAAAFNDTGWASGSAELGYGDGDEATTVSYGSNADDKHITTYFRKAFAVNHPDAIPGLTLAVKRDDGVILYLNGSEVFRSNMPSGTASYETAASSVAEEETYFTTSVDGSLLVPGTNVLAAEVHQSSGGSTDLSFDLELSQSTGGEDGAGFFIMSDVHITSSTSSVTTAISQMQQIDPNPLAGLVTGDLTLNATSSEWNYHNQIIDTFFDRTATKFGAEPRYLATLGNHDVTSSNWYSLWNNNMTGQRNLGVNGSSGIYYSFTHENALFVMLDSQHSSSAQTSWLESRLKESSAEFKFLFWHRPVYPCSTHSPYGSGMAWVDLAEENGVDAIFQGHTHVYSRTCPKLGGSCTSADAGVVYVETGTVGQTAREYTVTDSSVTGNDSEGNPRTDQYNCTLGEDLDASRESENTFCHLDIDGCLATVRCYTVGSGNTTPFDTWTLNHC